MGFMRRNAEVSTVEAAVEEEPSLTYDHRKSKLVCGSSMTAPFSLCVKAPVLGSIFNPVPSKLMDCFASKTQSRDAEMTTKIETAGRQTSAPALPAGDSSDADAPSGASEFEDNILENLGKRSGAGFGPAARGGGRGKPIKRPRRPDGRPDDDNAKANDRKGTAHGAGGPKRRPDVDAAKRIVSHHTRR